MPTSASLSGLARLLAAAAAACAWSGLALQTYLNLTLAAARGRTWAGELVFLSSFFTVLTNAIVAVTLTIPALMPRSRAGRALASPGVRTAAAVYISVVGLVYSAVLRALWNPQGLQKVADVLMHDAVPVLYVLFWMAGVPKGELRFRDVPRWLAYPFGYLVYTLVRGAAVDWYPYPFLDVSALGYARVVVNAAWLVLGFTGLSVIFVAAGRLLSGAATARPAARKTSIEL